MDLSTDRDDRLWEHQLDDDLRATGVGGTVDMRSRLRLDGDRVIRLDIAP